VRCRKYCRMSSDEIQEPAPGETILYAEQSGGGAPCAELQEIMDRILEEDDFEEVIYDHENTPLIDYIEPMLDALANTLASEEAEEEEDGDAARHVSVALLGALISIYPLDEADRLKFLDELEVDQGAREFLLEAVHDEKIRPFVEGILWPEEGVVRTIEAMHWSETETVNGKPRLLVAYCDHH